MSDYVFLVGDDYESSNKEYVSINSDKGKLISIALAASGIPFKGRFDKERMLWGYDGIYKESVDEIIAKFTSDDYAVQRNEIAEHKGDDSLYFLPAVAKILRMTEGTLRRRPMDIQIAVCKRYVDNWYCDTYTIQHELRDAMMLITKPEMKDSEKEKAVGKDLNLNTTSAVEKREKAAPYVSDEGIKVRVTYPDNVNDTIRQQKINKMYDIFLGAMHRNGTEETTE